MIQSCDLAVTALGSQGQAERWFGPALEAGVHLRWTFRSELGFPFGGFRLFRRPHSPGVFVDLPLVSPTASVVELPAVARAVTAEFVNPIWWPWRPAPQPLPAAVALFEGVERAASAATLSRSRAIARIEQDAINAVRVTTPPRWRLQRLRYIPVDQDADAGWTELRPLCLPLTDPHYPCHAGPTNVSADFEDAKARLTVDGLVDPLVLAQYLAADDWPQFHDHMRALCNPPIPASLAVAPPSEDEPAIDINTVDWMLLGAVDPYFARIIGVYSIDRPPSGAPKWDYKVTGRWLKTQLKAPERTFDFEVEREKRRSGHTFVRENLIIRAAHRGEVELVSNPPWKDTRRALNLQPHIPSPLPQAPAYLRVQFEEPVAEAQLYFRVHAGEPQIRTSVEGAVLSKWKSADGRFVILTAAGTEAKRIEFVRIDPVPGTGHMHLSLCKVGVLNEWSAPMTEERTWITYNVSPTASPSLEAPTGLVVERRASVSRDLSNGLASASPLAVLRWDIPTGDVFRYVIERQRLGSAAAPAAIDGDAWDPVNYDSPAGIPADEDAPRDLYIDDPSIPTGSSDRFYAYRIAAVDVFGRLSPFTAPFIADLIDKEPPPPPADVVATYLPESQAIRVRWDWTPIQRRQAPDAREFNVYARRGRLNAITGRITAVTLNGDGSFTVTTDRTLSANGANALAGEWLLSGGVYFTVVGNTAGEHVKLTVRAPAAPPPARPNEGTFTVSVRPPRFLEGTATKSRGHLEGTVTLQTDQHTDHDLTGKRLKQGGRLYRIDSNTTGDRFRLVVVSGGRPARSPGKGRFTVVEPDGTPFLVDPGNPLYVDPVRVENWPARLETRPLADPVAGQITSVVVDAEHATSQLTIDAAAIAGESPGGTISNAGRVFRVIDRSAGPPETITVENFTEVEGTTIVPSSGAFEYHPGYETTIPFELSPADEGVACAHVAVSTTDRSDNEGALSSPVQVQTPQVPPPIERPDAPMVIEPTPPDYYGRSFIGVQWGLRDGALVHVYRAIDEAIAAADRAARPARSQERTAYAWLTDDQFASLVIAQPSYDTLSDAELRLLAGLPGNDVAFGLITDSAVAADSHRATIDGRAGNRHCFAIKYLDFAGNRTALSWPSRCVRSPSVLAPRPPVVTKIVGGDRKITLHWAANREPGVSEYRIYRAGDEASASDLRTMTLIRTEAAGTGVLACDDSPLPGLVRFFYRLVAVSTDGLASAPSPPVACMAFDEAPPVPPLPAAAWVAVDSGSLQARITWPAAEATLLQRRVPVTGEWRAMTSWLPPGAQEFIDPEANASGSYEYRIWARKATGAVAIGSPVVLTAAG